MCIRDSAGADNNDGNESDEEHQRTQYAKEVHRLDAEGGKEPEGYQAVSYTHLDVYKRQGMELGKLYQFVFIHAFIVVYLFG